MIYVNISKMSLQQDNIAISMPPDEPANNSYIGRLKIKIGNINTFGLAAYICVFFNIFSYQCLANF